MSRISAKTRWSVLMAWVVFAVALAGCKEDAQPLSEDDTLAQLKEGVPGAEVARAEDANLGKNLKNDIGMEMVWVEPLKLWVGKYEVTQQEYEAITGENPSAFKGERYPVEQVSWNDAMAFIEKLNKREQAKLPKGHIYRLPYDAEYDVYVSKAGLDDSVTSLGEDIASRDSTSDVGSLQANDYGLHDTRGNVWEWMMDWYSKDIYSESSNKSPWAIGQRYKVLRGGSWRCDYSEILAVAYRYFSEPHGSNRNYGFRVVLGPVSH